MTLHLPRRYQEVRTAFLRAVDAVGGDATKVSDRHISDALGVSRGTVSLVRMDLDYPAYIRGPVSAGCLTDHLDASIQWQGSHAVWTGPVDSGGHNLVHWRRKTMTVARAVFLDHHGREPEGYVKSVCGIRTCVAAQHLADREMRRQGYFAR